jgi:hypothetical protein
MAVAARDQQLHDAIKGSPRGKRMLQRERHRK